MGVNGRSSTVQSTRRSVSPIDAKSFYPNTVVDNANALRDFNSVAGDIYDHNERLAMLGVIRAQCAQNTLLTLIFIVKVDTDCQLKNLVLRRSCQLFEGGAKAGSRALAWVCFGKNCKYYQTDLDAVRGAL